MERSKTSEFIFWGHAVLIVSFVLIGLFIHPLLALVLIVLHELQLLVFRGCILTRLEHKSRKTEFEEGYIQSLVHRITKKNISKISARFIDFGIKSAMLLLSIISLS